MDSMLHILQLQLHDRLDIAQEMSCGRPVVSCGFQVDPYANIIAKWVPKVE